MKTNTFHAKKVLVAFFAVLLPLVASAQTKVEIDGIWYNLIPKAKQAEVTSGDTKYSGSITIPATVTYEGVQYSVTSIGDMAFYYCSSLTAITLPESVTSIKNGAFHYCTSLTAINIPEGVTSIGSYALCNCSRLTAITIPEGVTSIGHEAFYGCRSLNSVINYSDLNIQRGSSDNGYVGYYANRVINVDECIDGYAFKTVDGVHYLNGYIGNDTELTLPNSYNNNNYQIGDRAFSSCSSLTTITLPEGVTSIGTNAFMYCSSLTAINIPKGVTSIGDYAFYYCSSLTAINIPENSKLTSIGSYAFEGCSSLTAIDIPASVTSIGNYAFRGCRSLTAITIPEGVTSIGDNAFSGCRSLTAINIPEGVTSIGSSAFWNCSSLTSITIPESVTSIGGSAFSDCSSLTSITIPEGSQLTSIGNSAFCDCISLTAIVLPKNLNNVGSQAFANCSELLDVYCYAKSVPQTEANAFEGSYPEYITLHVPANALDAYKTTVPWSNFGKFETFEITVENITLNQSTATLTEGEDLTLTAMVTPDDAADKSISWSSSNPSVATVDNTGKVTAVAPGTATITATANDGSGVSASCEVTVSPASYVLTAYIDGEVFVTDTLARGEFFNLIEPQKEGYTFSGWGEVPDRMPNHDLNLYATFIPNKYLVTFKIGDEVVAADSLEYKSAITAPEAPEKEGYTFNGWGEVADSVPANDLTYEGSYTINTYTLVYAVDGEVVLKYPIVYGGAIPRLMEPSKPGYTFSGWSDVPETMPAKDVTASGTFIPNKYLVTFKIGDEVVAADSLEYKSAIVAPEAPEKEGCTFNGWGVVADSVPAHDLTYEGSYSVNSYLLNYMVDGDVVLTLSVAYGATIPSLKAPEKEGYTFSGWSEAPATMPAKDVTIEGTFTQLPSVYLTINQADNGCVKQHLVQGTSCTFVIEAAEGWKIHTVTFDGEDVTSQLTEEGTFTTPELQGDAVLNIAYEKIDDAISHAQASRIKVQGHQGIISISGTTEGTNISLYTTDGTLVTKETAEDDTTHLTVPTGQVYIVKVADTVVKIGM